MASGLSVITRWATRSSVGAVHRLRRSGCVNMRFDTADLEQRFAADRYQPLMSATGAMAAVFLPALAVIIVPSYIEETNRLDSPFQWSLYDPRSYLYFVHASIAACGLIMIALCLLQHVLTRCDMELFVTLLLTFIVTISPLANYWYASLVWGHHPDTVWLHDARDGEMTTLMCIDAVVTTCCLFMPIRTSRLWAIPLSGFVSFTVFSCGVGSPFPRNVRVNIAMLLCLTVFAFLGARRHEQHEREKWFANRRAVKMDGELVEAAKLAKSLEIIASSVCDVVVHVSRNLCMLGEDPMRDAYLGAPMESSCLLELVPPADKGRVSELFGRADTSKVLEATPSMLELSFGFVQAQFSVISTSCEQPCFLLGIKIDEAFQPVAGEGCSPTLETTTTMACPNEDHLEIIHEDVASIPSLAASSVTGKVFADLEIVLRSSLVDDDSTHLHNALQSIVLVGEREHWLVGTSEILLSPDHVLGQGGFGLVIGGQLHGTPVAVKLARDRAQSVKVRALVSIANELRSLRQVRCPYIVQFHGACVDPHTSELALILELVQGVLLHDFICAVPGAPETHALHAIALQLARALSYLHAQHPPIVHGDLKPRNVIVESRAVGPHVKLLDFGLARLLTRNAKPLGGTPLWRPPEVACAKRRKLKPTTASDVFTFGRLVHFIMTGLQPLKDTSLSTDMLSNMLLRPTMGSFIWPEGMPWRAECRALCEKCCRLQPNLRCSSADARATIDAWPQVPVAGASEQAGGLVRGCMADLIASCVPWQEGLQRLHGLQQQPPSPQPQRQQQQQQQQQQQVSSSLSSSSSLLSSSQSSLQLGTSEAGRGRHIPFLYRELRATTEAAKMNALYQAMSMWNFPLPESSCCSFHAAVADAAEVLVSMAETYCRVFQPQADWQCDVCGTLGLRYTSTACSEKCESCGHRQRIPAADTAARAPVRAGNSSRGGGGGGGQSQGLSRIGLVTL